MVARGLLVVFALAAGVASAGGDATRLPWSLARTVDGVDAWSAVGNGEFWGLARGQVDAPPQAILDRITSFARLPQLHSWLDRVEVLERGPDHARVYFHYDLPWPLSDRSYTVDHHWDRNPSGTLFLDVDDAGVVPDDGAVHVEAFLVRLRLTPVRDGAASEVEYLLRADLAGRLPHAVRAQSAWKIPLNVVLSLRRALAPQMARR